MRRDRPLSDGLLQASGAAAVVLLYLGLIPGVIPIVAPAALSALLLALPLLALATVLAPPYILWRRAGRTRRAAPLSTP